LGVLHAQAPVAGQLHSFEAQLDPEQQYSQGIGAFVLVLPQIAKLLSPAGRPSGPHGSAQA
jgi:hypothetical protein